MKSVEVLTPRADLITVSPEMPRSALKPKKLQADDLLAGFRAEVRHPELFTKGEK